MNLTKKKIKNRFKKWLNNHPIDEDTFFYVQNAIGDIVGWEEWWAEFVKELMDENEN